MLAAVPQDLGSKLEPAELFHEVLEHRWFVSEKAGHEIPIEQAARQYVNDVLQGLPDEAISLVGDSMGQLSNPYDPSQGYVDDDDSVPYDPWEDGNEAPDADEPEAREFLDITSLRNKANKA